MTVEDDRKGDNPLSEELIQKGLTDHGIIISNNEYYNIGSTTVEQLKNYKIIPKKDYKSYSKRKPDGLFVNRSNKDIIDVIVVLEYKKPSDFRTNKQKIEAIQQCNDLCQVLDSNIGVITDSQVFIWINPKQSNDINDYIDKTTKKKRSYTIIRNEDQKDLSEPFLIQNYNEEEYDKLEEDTKNTLEYISRVLSCVDETNSFLKATQEVDPLQLAVNVWQDIYINTGKDPTKCLYNVVELFIFKFLSDLNVLKTTNSFDFLINMYGEENSNAEVLEHYAKNSRDKIRKLFPEGTDRTTIINGTIFVDSNGEPIQAQANLFKRSLEKYAAFGSLKNVKKEFKTKLFETFLKQSKDKSRLGQFFTPRKVIKAMVDMADVETLPDGSRVCDPFCGVGGFIAETIQKPREKKTLSH